MQKYNIEEMIVFEDADVIVCRKPSGFAVQSARFGVNDMESGLKNYLAAKNPGKLPYLGIVHRLDQPVEGLLVFAKTKQAAAELSRQMTAGNMGKHYLAVTGTKPVKTEGILEDYLRKDGKTSMAQVVKTPTPDAKKARLTWKLLQETEEQEIEGGKKYLLYICLETGRFHQIRVQMAHAGMGLLGDRKYHPDVNTTLPLGLCSFQLEFRHPKTKKKMNFEMYPSGEAFAGFDAEQVKGTSMNPQDE